MIINKELLALLKGYKKPFTINDVLVDIPTAGTTIIVLNEDATVRAYLNVYELMSIAKEWLSSINTATPSIGKSHYTTHNWVAKYDWKEFYGEAEYEATFKVCEFIAKKYRWIDND